MLYLPLFSRSKGTRLAKHRSLGILTLDLVSRAQVEEAVLPRQEVVSATRARDPGIRPAGSPGSSEVSIAKQPESRWQKQWAEMQDKVSVFCFHTICVWKLTPSSAEGLSRCVLTGILPDMGFLRITGIKHQDCNFCPSLELSKVLRGCVSCNRRRKALPENQVRREIAHACPF